MNLPLPYSRIALCYGIAAVTLHRWSHRGVSRGDLRSPEIVLEKLQKSATNDSVLLQKLSDPQTQREIKTAIEIAVAEANSAQRVTQ